MVALIVGSTRQASPPYRIPVSSSATARRGIRTLEAPAFAPRHARSRPHAFNRPTIRVEERRMVATSFGRSATPEPASAQPNSLSTIPSTARSIRSRASASTGRTSSRRR